MTMLRRISSFSGEFIRSALGSSKNPIVKMFLLLFAFAFLFTLTAGTASAVDPAPPAFTFTEWFGYEPSAWIPIIIGVIGGVIILVVPFKLGVRALMRVLGWGNQNGSGQASGKKAT